MKYIFVLFALCFCLASTSVYADPVDKPSEKERCQVCGMFVAKYPAWLAQLRLADGKTLFFDGVKDMMAWYFEPQKYGGSSSVIEVYVTDYYSQAWIDGTKAFYVSGSDTMGPMGHELIPFDSEKAAAVFKKDHHGKKILSFEQIDLEMIEAMRMGMKGMKKMKHN